MLLQIGYQAKQASNGIVAYERFKTMGQVKIL
jgi:hypothetical protein